MLKVLKVATFLSVACVTAASAAPGVSGVVRGKPAAGTTIELARASGCYARGCTASRHKASRRGEVAHRDRWRSRNRGHRAHYNKTRTRSASSGVSRSCLTSPARALLSRIESRFGPVQVISTCRPGARIAGSGRISRHASGNAVDFDAGGRKSQIVAWLVANHKSGGTMTYPAMSHVHVDIGPHFVSLAGGRRYASWSSRKRAGYRSQRMAKGYANRSHRVARGYAIRKQAIVRGASMARVDFDPDGDD